MPPRRAPPAPRFTLTFKRALRRGEDVWVAHAKFNGNNRATRRDIEAVSRELARRHPNSRLQVSTYTPIFTWMTGEWYDAGEAPKIWEPKHFYRNEDHTLPYFYNSMDAKNHPAAADRGHIDKFEIFARAQPAGGAKPGTNDCLFDAVYRHLQGKLGAGPANGAALKKVLGLARADLVPVGKMPDVEKLYGIAISLKGEAEYEGKKREEPSMRITLRNRHYEYVTGTKRWNVLWHWNKEGTHSIYIMDGKVGKIEKDPMLNILGDPHNFCCRSADDREGKNGKTMEEQWANWMTERPALLAHGVDMFETPTYAAAAIKELALAPKLIEWAKLPFDQQEVVQKASMGALIWGQNGFEGIAYQYDYNSFYPSLLEKHNFPKGPGEYMTIAGKYKNAKGVTFWPYGIYRLAQPLPAPDKGARPLWRTHGDPYYTHWDLEVYETHAKRPIVLADDGKWNLLRWKPADTAKGVVTFKPFVDKWYALKAKGVPGAKRVLTSLWGALSQKHKQPKEFAQGAFVRDDLGEIVSIRRVGNQDAFKIQFRPKDEIYSGLAPALGCFLMSLARYKMANLMASLEGVVRVHTDGFVVTKPITTELTSVIGGLKIEHDGKYVLRNVNSFTWSDDKMAKATSKK